MAETHTLRPPVIVETPAAVPSATRHATAAFRILQAGFVVAPVLAGLDKFTRVLVDWDKYLAHPIAEMLPVSTHTFMMLAGAIEVAAGILVALVPRIGAFVVAAWLFGITVNLLLPPGYPDIALRDFGLALAALSLGLLAKNQGSTFS